MKNAPKALRSAIFALYAQSLLSMAGGVAILVLIGSLDMSEEDGAGQLGFAAVVGIALGAVLLAGAILLPRRQSWVRTTVLVVESANLVLTLVTVIALLAAGGSFQPAVIAPIMLSFLVIQPLVRPEVRAWFADAPALPR